MRKILNLDGKSLTVESIFSFLNEEIDEINIQTSEKGKLAGNTLHRKEELTPFNPENHVLNIGPLQDKEPSIIALILILNASMKNGIDFSEASKKHILNYINKHEWPALHAANQDEISSLSELILVVEKSSHNGLCFSDAERSLITEKCFFSTALALWALYRSKMLVKTADLCTAMNMEAIRGELGAFDKRLHELGRPYPNQIIVAENVRRLLDGSEFTSEKARIAYGGDHGPRCQDAICIRAVPQTHGGVRDTLSWLEKNLNCELNNVSSHINPLIGYSLDLMVIALADLGNISERRSFRLNDSGLSYGLPMNLVGENPGFNHGFPVIQAASTAVLAELKLLALPSSAFSYINDKTNRYQCTTSRSGLKAIQANHLLAKVLSIEVLMSAQGMDLVRNKLPELKFGKGTNAAYAFFRKQIKMTKTNRYAAPDMVSADKLVSEGAVLMAAENKVGNLN